MTIIRLGYVAMSMELTNASPSKTMTFARFQTIADREAAFRKLERIAQTNLRNCLRLLKHNLANGIEFFRFSSRLIPLADHPELADWRYMDAIKEETEAIKAFLLNNEQMRVDFHPDHFVVLNTGDEEILKTSIKTMKYHAKLLKAIGINPRHRCVLHVGGMYQEKEKALERFIHNWAYVPASLQEMIILENDDTLFHVKDALYLCEKLGIPLVFDLHHHRANHVADWREDWERIVGTWAHSELPVKVHLSSPRDKDAFKAHADYVEITAVEELLRGNRGLASHIDCMLEAKQKDRALFAMANELRTHPEFQQLEGAVFRYQSHS